MISPLEPCMSDEPLTCPYCNAFVSLPLNAQDGQRVTCTRCGDAFSLRGIGRGIKVPPGVATAPTPSLRVPGATITPPARWGNRLVAGIAVGVMALMAATGLTWALVTQAQRRANDYAEPVRHKRPIFPEPDDDKVSTLAVPAKLEALGYLPPGTNIIAGVHVRQLRQSKGGLKLLSDSIKTSRGEIVLGKLFLWTGVNVEQLDHVVVGARTEGVEFPRVVVVARTQRPIDRRTVRSTLKAEEREERDGPRKGQMLYRFQVASPPVRPTLWFADDYTMVFDLLGQLEDIPARPHGGLERLPFEVRDALKTHVDPGSLVWLVGTFSDWEKTAKTDWFKIVRTFVGTTEKERLDRLMSLSVVAVGAQPDPEAKARADIRCTDVASAKALRVALVGPDGAQPPPGVTAFLEGDWLTVQWKGDLDAALKALAK
jgi:hypothetical protein